ncbi:MAG: alpha/beta fold hydrolase [Nitriliruptorales bacterium]|nr:alpha/beta fold hydrolase [Nitriliruptorales bacterium]
MYAEIVGPEEGDTLLLLHGGIGTGHYHWSKQIKALGAEYRLHLPDLPGHGRTPLPDDGSYNREVLVEAIERYLDDLGGAAHVMAFSMGGHACLALATRRPDVFRSLTLIGVSVGEHQGLDGWRHRFDPDELERTYPVWARHLSRIHEPLGGPDAWKDVCRRDSKGLRVDIDVAALEGLTAPTMLVRGDRDPAVDPQHYAQLRSVWPHADEFVVPAGAHDVQLTRARVVQPVLLEFLTRAAGAE